MSARRKEFCIVCDNIRSTHNVGSIFRTSDAAGIDKIYLCGITPRPPRPDISKVSLGAEEFVPFEYKKSAGRTIKTLTQKGFKIVALENNVKGAKDFRNFKPKFPLALVIGSEVDGLPQKILSLANSVIYIPMHGKKESLNVSVAFGIVAYHIAMQRT